MTLTFPSSTPSHPAWKLLVHASSALNWSKWCVSRFHPTAQPRYRGRQCKPEPADLLSGAPDARKSVPDFARRSPRGDATESFRGARAARNKRRRRPSARPELRRSERSISLPGRAHVRPGRRAGRPSAPSPPPSSRSWPWSPPCSSFPAAPSDSQARRPAPARAGAVGAKRRDRAGPARAGPAWVHVYQHPAPSLSALGYCAVCVADGSASPAALGPQGLLGRRAPACGRPRAG